MNTGTPHTRKGGLFSGHPLGQHENEKRLVSGFGTPRPGPAVYIFGVSMMCAFDVPGNMIHGDLSDGLLDNPVVALVANGMYVT